MPIPKEPSTYSSIEGSKEKNNKVDPTKISKASDSLKPTVSNPTTSSSSMRKASSTKKIDSTSMVIQ